VQTAVMGNVVQAGEKMNPARQAAVNAGLPVTTPAMTVNRVCGSGAQAIVSAAQDILLGNIDVAVAGGMESMDQAPYLVARGRWGYRMGDGQLFDSVLRDGLNDAFSDKHSGLAHRRPGREISGDPRRPGPLCAALAATLRCGAGRRSFQVADRAGRGARQKGSGHLRQG
jgi:acetyl-CoA acetyltransferase